MFLSRSAKSLHFAIRLPVVAKHLGLLLLPLAALFCVPVAVAAFDRAWGASARMGAVVVLLAVAGALLSRLRCSAKLQTNEALVVTALVFATSSLVFAFPLAAYGLPLADAAFEAVSGITTTGLSTLPTVEDMPWSFLFARAWLQWVGGLGVVVLAVAMLIRPGTAARRLGFDEREADDLAGGTRSQARRVLLVYGALTLASFGLLWALGAGASDALTHALAAISTGGFSTHDTSLDGLAGPWVVAGVMLTCFAGALPMAWYYGLATRGRSGFPREMHAALVLVLLVGALALLPFMHDPGEPWSTTAGDSLTMAVSAGSTAGFTSVSVADLPAAAKLVLIGLMTIGGEQGSTAGGVKILRVLVLLALLRRLLESASLPRASRVPLHVGKTKIDADESETVVAVVLAYLGVMAISWLAFLAYGHEPLDSLFEVASATGTVGLSSGLTSLHLEPLLKVVLCLDMLIGRVEIVGFLLIVFPPTWIGRRRPWRSESSS